MAPERKEARQALRKAQTLDVLAEVVKSQEAHGREMQILREAINEHTAHQFRLSASVWARVVWLMTGR